MDVAGGPVVKTLYSQCRGRRFKSLVRELRSHMPQWGQINKLINTPLLKKNKNSLKNMYIKWSLGKSVPMARLEPRCNFSLYW